MVSSHCVFCRVKCFANTKRELPLENTGCVDSQMMFSVGILKRVVISSIHQFGFLTNKLEFEVKLWKLGTHNIE